MRKRGQGHKRLKKKSHGEFFSPICVGFSEYNESNDSYLHVVRCWVRLILVRCFIIPIYETFDSLCVVRKVHISFYGPFVPQIQPYPTIQESSPKHTKRHRTAVIRSPVSDFKLYTISYSDLFCEKHLLHQLDCLYRAGSLHCLTSSCHVELRLLYL